MIFKCDCCGYEQDFVDDEAAFQAGWDAPPHFTGYVACDLCPAAFQFDPQGWAKHASVHERWAREGRPEDWSQETCLEPEDRVPQAVLDHIKKVLGGEAAP